MTDEVTPEITAQQVIDAEMMPALRAENEKMRLALRDLEYQASALQDVMRLNVASAVLPHFLKVMPTSAGAIEVSREVADQFASKFSADMEANAAEYSRKVLEQEDAEALKEAVEDDDETVQ